MNWYLEALRKYAVFDGRARRMEYWMFVLINCLIAVVLSVVDTVVGVVVGVVAVCVAAHRLLGMMH